ncbi:MAG: pilus assembly protein TadG-related protein [Mariprofundus sp.]
MDVFRNRDKGAILIMTAVMIVVLIGIGALALDIGRLLVLNTEIHNAADSAALAAAYELDGNSGARSRAKKAARKLLTHTGHFGQTSDLLNASLPDSKITFYYAVGSADDPPCSDVTHHCLATDDSEAHYVKVVLDSHSSYTIDLLFLPVLEALPSLSGVPTVASVSATATAGRKLALSPLGVQLYE